MFVAIVDYGSGNLRSAARAFFQVAAQDGAGTHVTVTADPEVVRRADRVVVPGVGAFADCMAGLTGIPGMVGALTEAVHIRAVPVLGICVGMQIMADKGLEYGEHKGLGWIKGEVRPLSASPRKDEAPLKIPHMGWNDLVIEGAGHPLLAGLGQGAHGYFVHSYHLVCADPADCLATVSYGGRITAAVARGNVAGTQFHPEKSQAVGLRVIANFLHWAP